MTLVQNNFNGGTDGAGTTGGITAGNSANSGNAFTVITLPTTNGTFSYDATGARAGLGGRWQLASATGTWRAYHQWTAASSAAGRWVFCLNSLPGVVIVLGTYVGSSTFGIACSWRINATSFITVNDTAGATLATSSSAITAGVVYVMEIQVAAGTTTANGTCNAQLYAVASPGTLLINLANSACNMLGATNPNISRAQMGEADAVTNLDVTFDDLAFNSGTTTAIGPPATDAAITPAVLAVTTAQPAVTVVIASTVTPGTLAAAAAQPAAQVMSRSGPAYAGAAADLGGGTGSWTAPANADGAPDGTCATWIVV